MKPIDSTSRRRVLELMAASFGLTACRRPVENILPASFGSESRAAGVPLWYATAMTVGGVATGLLVESHEGRPTKIEGNPKHPSSLGATNAFAQAAVLGLFDPHRSQRVLFRGKASTWEEFGKQQFDLARLRILSERVGSPSLEAVRSHVLARFPGAKWIEYEPISQDQAMAGAQLAFGEACQPHYHFDQADVVVSLDSDFLGLDAPSMASIRDFARRRRGGAMNRLYVVEGQYSLTGAMADHRLRMRPSEVRDFAGLLALRKTGLATGQPGKWLAALGRDMDRHPGRTLIVAGPRQPAEVHALAHVINEAQAGACVSYTRVEHWQPTSLSSLAQELAAGQVETLVILGGNPAFNAPAALISKAKVSIRLGLEEDETSAVCTWHLPEAHFLESWGDGRALDGTVSVQQPLIAPLYGGRTAAEVVALISGYKDTRAYDIVRNHLALDEKSWRRALHDGVVAGTQSPEVKPKCKAVLSGHSVTPPPGRLEVSFYPSASTWDGRFAGNVWLQETPDPITKLTWDNAALVSPRTARRLGLATGELVVLSRDGREVTIPVMIQPGHADECVSLALGYGRKVGHDVYPLFTTETAWAEIRKTGKQYPLAVTQGHHSMEGRPLALESGARAPRDQPLSLYKERTYDQGNQWGLAIDLSACVGCNACVVACQAENNIPVVGKEQVLRGREMHWIRLDRYYEGSEEDPQSITQPVNCQQCENAPCENVCPVAATTHSPEGLNDMAYNRCVGTRYCANNCPYKVRRFNFLDYHKAMTEVGKMVQNPDVTVRARGVMEKCTYCVQRIQEKKIQAKREGHRAIRDGEIVTACQQVCPAEAIVFGDLRDPSSRVAQLSKDSRGYALLAELHTKPRTTYLAKLRNRNPEMP